MSELTPNLKPELTPVGRKVLIQPLEVPNSGKILLHNQKPHQYKVINIGDDVTKVSVGNIIYLEKHYGIEIEHNAEKFLVIDENSILAKIQIS